MRKLHFMGIDRWDRPVYQDESGRLWKDINLGSGVPDFYSSSGNDFDGEPDMPMKGKFVIIRVQTSSSNM